MSAVAIKVSSSLASEARAAAVDADRSLTGQIEHWARIGKALEPLFNTPVITALKRSGGDLSVLEDEQERAAVLDALAAFRATPREAIADQLGLHQRVRIEPDPDHSGGFIRIQPDGSREQGTLQGRQFVPA